jgi:hypothetical protein
MHVTGRKDTRTAGLQQIRLAILLPESCEIAAEMNNAIVSPLFFSSSRLANASLAEEVLKMRYSL